MNSYAKLRGPIRFCAIVMAALAIYVMFLSGPLNQWRILIAVVMLACPVMAIWAAWKFGRSDQYKSNADASAENRHS